jgi:hypothetical protein
VLSVVPRELARQLAIASFLTQCCAPASFATTFMPASASVTGVWLESARRSIARSAPP